MVKCPSCGSKNDDNNVFCLECGNNLKSLETTKFNKKAILIGLIVIFFLNWIVNLIFIFVLNLSLLLWAVFMIFIFFIGGLITGYIANKLYISSAILNGLVVGIIYATFTFISISNQYPVLYVYTYTSLILMIVSCGLGGGLGELLKFKRKSIMT